jgi:hypothetical protein
VPGGPGPPVRGPSGWSLDRKEEHAAQLPLPSPTRRALARASAALVAAPLPTRRSRVLGAGGDASQEAFPPVPAPVDGVSRRLSPGKLSALPAARGAARRGGPPKKGPLRGAPKPLARQRAGGQPPPPAAGVLVPPGAGLWPPVRPGRLIRGAGRRRPRRPRARKPGPRPPLPPGAAFFTTALPWRLAARLAQDRERGAVAILLRASTACPGLGQDQGRKHERVVGAHPLRVGLAAARPLGVMAQVRPAPPLPLQRSRPGYRQQCAPSHLALLWSWRAALHAAGVFPLPRFAPGRAEIPQELENNLPLAA